MSRIVLAASGSEGDVHPFIAVGIALTAMGLTPVIATRASFRPKVEGAGLLFHPVRPDVADLEAMGVDAETLARGVTDPVFGLRFLLKRAILAGLRQSYDDLMEATESAGLVVAHGFAFAARLAAETRGLPWRTAVLQPSAFLSTQDPPSLGLIPALDALRPLLPRAAWRAVHGRMREVSGPWFEPLHRLRAEVGLPPAEGHPLFEGQFSPAGTLGLYSPLLGAVQADFPPATVLTGFPFFDGEPVLPPGLEAFLAAGDAPLVFSLGTAATLNAGDFFAASLEAAATGGRRAVLLTGAALPPAVLPPSAFACPYAPHSLLLPRAAAVVHQGGIGVSGQALRAGRPQLIVPVMADQPDNARRLARLGVARVLPRRRYTALSAARALNALLRSPHGLKSAQNASYTVMSEDGAARAAADIAAWLD